MDGSQLPTEWTHLNEKLVSGVSDSKMRDVSLNKTGMAAKKGPKSEKSDVQKISKMSKSKKMSDAPQNLDVAKNSEGGTVG